MISNDINLEQLFQEADRIGNKYQTAVEMNLEQLFQEADRIGNKYQTAEERAAFEQEIADIAKDINWDVAM